MIIRLVKGWNYLRVGHVLPIVPDGLAGVLIARGIAEYVIERNEQNNRSDASDVAAGDALASSTADNPSERRHKPRR